MELITVMGTTGVIFHHHTTSFFYGPVQFNYEALHFIFAAVYFCFIVLYSFMSIMKDQEPNQMGCQFGKVYSEMNGVKINKTFQGGGRSLAANPQPTSSAFGVAGPVMVRLNEVAGGKGGINPHLMSGHPSSPVPHPMWRVETRPGGVEAR